MSGLDIIIYFGFFGSLLLLRAYNKNWKWSEV